MINKYCGALILSIALILTATGCNYNKGGVKTNQYKAQSTDGRHMVNGTNAYTASYAKNKSMADKIAKHITTVKGVTKTTVIVNNRDVLAGVDVKPGANTAAVATSVKHSVERMHPGYKVHVTADRALHARIRTLNTQLVPLNGHPVRNFAVDIATLIRDIGRTATAPFHR